MTVYNIIMRKYNILNGSNVIGTFETKYNLDNNEWLQNVLEQVFDGATGYSEIVEQPVLKRNTRLYYFYRYVSQNCQEIKFLGTFETDRNPLSIWDILFQVFCNDGSEGGMFIRKEKINQEGNHE